jgi:hypothetical protein
MRNVSICDLFLVHREALLPKIAPAMPSRAWQESAMKYLGREPRLEEELGQYHLVRQAEPNLQPRIGQRQAIADNPWLWEMGEIEDSSRAFQYRRSAAQRHSRHHRS